MSGLLFAYGSFRVGEPDHAALSEATPVGGATLTGVRLVDLGAYPALIHVGAAGTSDEPPVVGELYQVTALIVSRLDLVKQHPALFQRELLTLPDGRSAYAYMMAADQVRGRKRLRTGDWKQRFQPVRRSEFTAARRWHR